MKAIVSIHDLMPETMEHVDTILAWLAEREIPPVTLLVVPGKPWTERQIARLRELADLGYPLAAHGWHHRTTPRRVFHRLHGALISRNVAEHLALDSQGILNLTHRARQWFIEQNLPIPEIYVPPAWALGNLSPHHQAATPFKVIETTRGLLFPDAEPKQRFEKFPVTGYEADTALRAAFLRRWNNGQATQARRTLRPLRISIHPNDLHLRLAPQLEAQIHQVATFINYPHTPTQQK